MDAAARKEAIRAFKEKKAHRGVFAVRCIATGRVWVGPSMNLDASATGQAFFVRQGNHPNRELQQEFDQAGADAFRFEALEALPDDVPLLELNDVLKARTQFWRASLNARPV